MSEITRRSLLTGAAAAGVLLAAAPSTGRQPVAARVNQIPQTREEHRAVVVGSGVGGGVSALRLAPAGVPEQ
ncbi:twin-arginine translocation signal domain-containing protein, partial [Nocardia farcinica]|uniref:twin-arginine translocation signal domain-containing protein n=1 Tax=Nocardia farcinica TaxID=37329 RepID=UPI002454D2D4